MSRIDIHRNPDQSEHLVHLKSFLKTLIKAAAGCELRADPRYLEFIAGIIPEARREIAPISTSDGEPTSLALSIGGDGTFLTTANRIGASGTPIMGINSGHLGYLSATDIARADHEIARLITEGDYRVESRTVIAVDSASPLPSRPFALNEVAFLKQDTASMITVTATVNGNKLASYSGDGLLVSTPTGSTGYNLSVGGPIMSPRCADWIISPIAPHSLSMRPLVVPDSVTLEISTQSRSKTMLLAIDGRATPLPVESRFTLSKAPFNIHVAHLKGHTFTDTLRHKLHWGAE